MLAEGAKFMMISPQYEVDQLQPDMPDIRSFNYLRVIRPTNPDLLDLQRRLGVCGEAAHQHCKLVAGFPQGSLVRFWPGMGMGGGVGLWIKGGYISVLTLVSRASENN